MDYSNDTLAGEWRMSSENLTTKHRSIQWFSKGGYGFFPHLPSYDTKCVYVAGRRGSGIGEPPWPRVDQFWGRAGERSIDVLARHSGR